MEVVSNQNSTTDLQWQRIVIAFNASSKEYTGARSQRIKQCYVCDPYGRLQRWCHTVMGIAGSYYQPDRQSNIIHVCIIWQISSLSCSCCCGKCQVISVIFMISVAA